MNNFDINNLTIIIDNCFVTPLGSSGIMVGDIKFLQKRNIQTDHLPIKSYGSRKNDSYVLTRLINNRGYYDALHFDLSVNYSMEDFHEAVRISKNHHQKLD